MNKLEKTPINGQAQQNVPSQKRAWVTPTFEQVALKEALNTPTGDPTLLDTVTFSS